MQENELNLRREGFMIATGLLLKNAEPNVRDSILKTLKSYDAGLHLEIENGQHGETASIEGVNPCAEGWHWDPVAQACVPD